MRRKKYNPLKALQMQSLVALGNVALVMVVGSTKTVQAVSLKTLRPIVIHESLAHAVDGFAYKWHIECSALLRDQNGDDYVQSERVVTLEQYKHSDPALLNFLNTEHQKFIRSVNQLHLITAAWTATIKPVEINLIELYSNLGGFNHPSKWESQS